MTLAEIIQGHAKRIDWFPVDDGDGTRIEPGQHYFRLRLKEMYLYHTRQFWVTLYPMVFAFADHGEQTATAIAGPTQLSNAGMRRLDRAITLNYALTEPIVYTGEDIEISAGLCSVPSSDAARLLVDTAAALAPVAATLGAPHVAAAVKIAKVLKDSVGRMLELDGRALRLGIDVTLNDDGGGLAAGSFVAVEASGASKFRKQLRLSGGRLVHGEHAMAFDETDFMVIEIERITERSDYARLPGIAEFQETFASIMRDTARNAAQKKRSIASVWPAFHDTLASSKLLTDPDRDRIASLVEQNLLRRLSGSAAPTAFESKGIGGKVAAMSPFDFTYADIADAQPDGARTRARLKPNENPFAG